jgi:hypothetical protein
MNLGGNLFPGGIGCGIMSVQCAAEKPKEEDGIILPGGCIFKNIIHEAPVKSRLIALCLLHAKQAVAQGNLPIQSDPARFAGNLSERQYNFEVACRPETENWLAIEQWRLVPELLEALYRRFVI